MKHLLYISLIFLCSITTFGQTKYLVNNGEIVQTGLPEVFTRPNGKLVYGGYKNLPDSIHYNDGWRDGTRPAIDNTLQRYGQRFYDVGNDVVTWEVIDKTADELAAEKESLLQSIDENFDVHQIKKLLIILTKSILNSDSVTADELTAIATIYPQYRENKAYELNEVFVYDSTLYKVVQPHTSQADWFPDATPALYTAYTPPGQVSDWVQPTGGQDAYNTGDRVRFNGSIYESLIDANVWSPTAYPAGWQLIE